MDWTCCFFVHQKLSKEMGSTDDQAPKYCPSIPVFPKTPVFPAKVSKCQMARFCSLHEGKWISKCPCLLSNSYAICYLKPWSLNFFNVSGYPWAEWQADRYGLQSSDTRCLRRRLDSQAGQGDHLWGNLRCRQVSYWGELLWTFFETFWQVLWQEYPQ